MTRSPGSPDLERRRRELGVTESDDRTIARSLAAKTRADTGAEFENELDVMHARYEFQKWGKIRRNYIPTRVVGRGKKGAERRAVGAAHADRSGWVSVWPYKDETCGDHEWRWRGESWKRGGTRIVPVAFDAKVLGLEHATYQHEVKKQHQLHDLKAAAEAGEFAFLLVLARQVSSVFAIPILNHFSDLLSGRGVKLYEKRPWLAPGGYRVDPLLPSIDRRGVADVALGWDWIPLLQWCDPADG